MNTTSLLSPSIRASGKLLCSVLLAGLATPAMAVTQTWDGGGSGTGTSFTTSTNWSGNALPSTGDDALFSSITPSSLNSGSNRTVGDIIWNIDASVTHSTSTGATANARIALSGASDNTALLANGGAAGDLFLVGSNVTTGTYTLSGVANGSGFVLGLTLNTAGNFNIVNAGAALSISSIITSADSSAGFTKTGAGTVILSGNSSSTYTAATAVNAGTLLLQGGNIGGSAVTVNSGGTLAGNGTIGALTVQNGGAFTPGAAAIGDITAASAAFNSTSAANFGIDGAGAGQFDTLTSAGTISLDGSFNLGFGNLLADGTSIDLFLGTTSSAFTSIAATGSYSGSFALESGSVWTLTSGSQVLSFDNSTGVLSVAAVPEPAAGALIMVGMALGVLSRRRRETPHHLR